MESLYFFLLYIVLPIVLGVSIIAGLLYCIMNRKKVDEKKKKGQDDDDDDE